MYSSLFYFENALLFENIFFALETLKISKVVQKSWT